MAGINLFYNFSNPFEKDKEKQRQSLIKKNYDEIYSHELAHKSTGGALAGSIVIEKNSQGIPVSGHVDIKMPSLDPKNPQKTINDTNTVIKSAMAPSNPSGQDYKVANEASSIKMRAEAIKSEHSGKNIDYRA